MGVGCQSFVPAALPQGKRPGTHCTGSWEGPREGLDGCGKSRPPRKFDPRTVQPVASRYTDWAIPAHNVTVNLNFWNSACSYYWKAVFSPSCKKRGGNTYSVWPPYTRLFWYSLRGAENISKLKCTSVSLKNFVWGRRQFSPNCCVKSLFFEHRKTNKI